MSKHSNQPVQPSPPTGFQLPTSHSVQLKPVRPPPQPFPTSLNTSPRENVTPSSPNTSSTSNNLPPPIATRPPIQSPTSPNVIRKMPPPPPSTSTQQSMPPPPPVVHLPQSTLIKKLSPQSSPILPKRIVSSPPLNGLNPNNNTNNQGSSVVTSLPPPIVHLPPPPPQSMLNSLNTSGGNMPPPPSTPPPRPPPTVNSLGNSGGIPPPSSPQYSNNGPTNTFVNSASSNVSPQLHSQSTFLKPPPPVPTRSASLDPKQMSQFIKTSPSHQSSSSFLPSTGPTMPLPPFVSISPLKRNSIDATNNNNNTTNNHPHFSPPSLSPSNSQLNVKRLSTQDLNSMLVNRLQHGLSPPVATPFFDDKVLGSAAKSQELKEKRDIEEKERRERERIKKEKDESEKKEKKDKKGKEDQEKKDKKKKEEQEKLDKKEKKKKEDAEKKLKSSKGELSGSNGIVNTNIFSNSLEQIMENQRSTYPHLSYPVVLKLLSEGVLNLNGQNAEGIFRITGSGTEVNRLKKQINELDFTSIDSCSDPHVLASLLKLWLRELTSPVIPTELYYDCIKSRSKEEVTRIYNSLPEQNKQLLVYLLAFLKNISQPHFAVNSKMDIHNVSMVFSPGLLRCPTTDTNMLLNTQYEKDFIMCLIELSP